MEYQTTTTWLPHDTVSLIFSLAALSIVYFIASSFYDAYFGPLSKFPGPKLNAISVLPAIITNYTGRDNIDLPAMHAKYGPAVRTAPNHISYTGAAAFKDVYGFGKKGLEKDPQFYGKPLNKVDSIITADDAGHSRQRPVARPPDAQSPKGSAPTQVLQLRSGYALPSSQHLRHVLILNDADLSP